MKRPITIVLSFAILPLFFLQLAGTLVESIYILDLLNTKLDEKALGVLFFFAPVLVFPFFKRDPRRLAWVLAGLLVLARGLVPYVNTSSRVLAAGLGTAAVLALYFLMLYGRSKDEHQTQPALWGSAGLGLALVLSIFLRTWGDGLDYSLTPAGGWLGWVLGLLLGSGMVGTAPDTPGRAQKKEGKVTAAAAGIILILTLIWFSFAAPSVIARWTEGNYTMIVAASSLLAAGWVWISLSHPQWLERIRPGILIIWNILFTLSLTATLLAQRVAFPPAPDSAPVVATSPGLFGQASLVVMLLLFPVLFLDMHLFLNRLRQAAASPRDLASGFLLGTLVMVLLIFLNIFSNVWGYVPPVSPYFRGTFWLAYFVLAAGITLLTWSVMGRELNFGIPARSPVYPGLGVVLTLLLLSIAGSAWPPERVQVDASERNSLVVMTFNIQQSNDDSGEKSFGRQLELMRRVSPDIIALQESDSARISLNNNDYVRYFAEQLGYYSYYGPTPVTGTYGTAILSRFPLMNTRTVFTYSDTDEIGTAVAEIEAGGRRFTIYNVHPAGSDPAMLAFTRSLLERSQDDPNVIALGDYNLRDYEAAYQLIDDVYLNAWTSVYPGEISPEGINMSGENRIDHIFVSPGLEVRNPTYVLPPDSATDHPVHWAEIAWEKP